MGVALVCLALLVVLVDPGPSQAATIPKPPAVCHPPKPVPGNPIITSLALKPTSVNVLNQSKKVTFTIQAKDSHQNITEVLLALFGPIIDSASTGGTVALKRVSGTAKDGTWRGSFTVPRWTHNGTWSIGEVRLDDAGGAAVLYQPVPDAKGIKAYKKAWHYTFGVTAKPDLKPPTLTSVSLSPTSVDTSTTTKKIDFTVKAKDDRSGIKRILVTGYSDSLNYRTSEFRAKAYGTAKNRTYKGSFVVPRWGGQGAHKWHLHVTLVDAAGNRLEAESGELYQPHIPTFKVTSRTDDTGPVLKGLSFSPAQVDARSKNKAVSVFVEASDTQSGVASGWVRFTSPSGFVATARLHHAGSGTWTASVGIPRCSEPGIWTVSAGLMDVTKNGSKYPADAIKALHFTNTLTVKSLDVQLPTAKIKGKVHAAGPLLIAFSEPTLWKTSPYPLTVRDKTDDPVAGTWTCKNASAATVGCYDNGADVTTASFVPATNFGSGLYTVSGSGEVYDTSGNGPIGVYLSFGAA